MKLRNPFAELSVFELILWLGSLAVILVSFLLSGNSGWLSCIASLLGATGLIFVAKGDVLGQILIIIFSLLYAVISFEFRYYGEMITYVGMSAPIALLSVISWLRHPFKAGKAEVQISRLTLKRFLLLLAATAVVTTAFYFILGALGTSNLIVSTVSVATSFLASSLMFYRCPGYALAYAANDIVLIVLWVLAACADMSFLPMVFCFSIFLLNDLYGFYNWTRIRRRQSEES